LTLASPSVAPDGGDDFVRVTHRRLARRRAAVILAGLVVTALSFVVDVATGPAMLPLRSVALSVVGLSGDATVDAIVWAIRLPVALMALAVGAALGLSGALMQTILNNPLASSYTLGISAGAGFGAALVIVAGPPLWLSEGQAIPLAAMAFAGVSCAIVHLVGRLRGATPEMRLEVGVGVAPVWWTPSDLRRRVFACLEAAPLTLPSSGPGSSSWRAPAARPRISPRNSNRAATRSAPGWRPLAAPA
jgi:ABC-type enterobactin transport system permease subunit